MSGGLERMREELNRLIAELYGTQMVVELRGHRAGLSVLGYHIFFAGVDVVNFAYRGCHGGFSALGGFLHSFKLFEKHGAAFHFQTHVLCYLLEAHVGD